MNFCYIIQVTGEETWVSFVSVEPKQQSKQWMHTHSPNKVKKFKHFLPESLWVSLVGQERSADGGIHAMRDHSNVTSIFQNTKKLRSAGHSEQNAWNADFPA
jgi:hypothetical protein